MLSFLKTLPVPRRLQRQQELDDRLERLKLQLLQDRTFLEHDPVAVALIDRYWDLVAESTQHRPVESAADFRRRIGLGP